MMFIIMIIIWPKLITLNEVCFICIWKVEHATSFSFRFLLTQISKVSMCQFSSPHQSGIHWTDDGLNQSNPKPLGPDWIFSPADWTGPFHTLPGTRGGCRGPTGPYPQRPITGAMPLKSIFSSSVMTYDLIITLIFNHRPAGGGVFEHPPPVVFRG